MVVRRGMWLPPDGVTIDIEHYFTNATDPFWPSVVRRIQGQGRTPLITILPGDDFGGLLERIKQTRGVWWLRYAHEFNGDWYPWGGEATTLKQHWTILKQALPPAAGLVWCPNINYPGGDPIAQFWPDGDVVDVIGLDGYACLPVGRDPVPPNQLFGGTLTEIRQTLPKRPILLCETASPRDNTAYKQSTWARDLLLYARRERLAGVVWFNEDKSDGQWALGQRALRVFVR